MDVSVQRLPQWKQLQRLTKKDTVLSGVERPAFERRYVGGTPGQRNRYRRGDEAALEEQEIPWRGSLTAAISA